MAAQRATSDLVHTGRAAEERHAGGELGNVHGAVVVAVKDVKDAVRHRLHQVHLVARHAARLRVKHQRRAR